MSINPGDKVNNPSIRDGAVGKVLFTSGEFAWVDFGNGPYTTQIGRLTKVEDTFEVGKLYVHRDSGSYHYLCLHVENGMAFFQKSYSSGTSGYSGSWLWCKQRDAYSEID